MSLTSLWCLYYNFEQSIPAGCIALDREKKQDYPRDSVNTRSATCIFSHLICGREHIYQIQSDHGNERII